MFSQFFLSWFSSGCQIHKRSSLHNSLPSIHVLLPLNIRWHHLHWSMKVTNAKVITYTKLTQYIVIWIVNKQNNGGKTKAKKKLVNIKSLKHNTKAGPYMLKSYIMGIY